PRANGFKHSFVTIEARDYTPLALGQFSLRVLRDGAAVAWSVAAADVRDVKNNNRTAPNPPRASVAVADWRDAAPRAGREVLSPLDLNVEGPRRAAIWVGTHLEGQSHPDDQISFIDAAGPDRPSGNKSILRAAMAHEAEAAAWLPLDEHAFDPLRRDA